MITGGNSDSLVKNGNGTLTLAGANTYTGSTVVNAGTVVVNGTSIADTAKVVLNGGKLEITANETVGSLSYGTTAQAAGTYGSTASGATFQDDTRFSGTGVLTVVSGGGFSSWIGGFGLPVEQQGVSADPDGDGIDNLLEMLLGGNPASGADANKVPTASTVAGNAVFTFTRQREWVDAADLKIHVGMTLEGWPTTYTVGKDTASSTPGVTVTDNGNGTDTVTLTLPIGTDRVKFTRLGATLK